MVGSKGDGGERVRVLERAGECERDGILRVVNEVCMSLAEGQLGL